MRCRWWLIALLVAVDFSWAGEMILGLATVDSTKLRKQQGVEKFVPSARALKAQRVVVVDRSFEGFVQASGQLPPSASLFAGPLQFPKDFYDSMSAADREFFQEGRRPDEMSYHGIDNAKIHHAMMGGFVEGPEYALVVAGDVKGIRRAAKFADWWGAGMVICAQNMPTVGNRDGLGEEYQEIAAYLNRDPRRIWVNSAGNYERATHTAPIQLNTDNQVVFKNGKPYLRLKMRVDGEIIISAVYNSFNKNGTDNNLDLYVLGEDGRSVYSWQKMSQNAKYEVKSETLYAQSEKVQHVLQEKKKVPPPPEPGLGAVPAEEVITPPSPAPAEGLPEAPTPAPLKSSKPVLDESGEAEDELIPPVEEVVVPLKKNSEGKYYYIELVSKGGSLSLKDEVRVIVRPKMIDAGFVPDDMRKNVAPAMELVDWTSGQNVYYPADFKHQGMIVVGEVSNNSSRGPTANGVPKPTVFMPMTEVVLSNGRSQNGTSVNTFLFAGHLGLLKAQYPQLTQSDFGRFTKVLDYLPTSVKAQAITDLWKDDNTWKEQHLPFLTKQFPDLFDTLWQASQLQIQSVGIDPNGMYQFGYPVSPATFRSLFGEVSETADAQYEYFLAFWEETEYDESGPQQPASRHRGLTRKVRTDSDGEEESYPWLRDDAPTRDPRQYVQIRRMRGPAERQMIRENMDRSFGRVYRVPTDEELKTFFGN